MRVLGIVCDTHDSGIALLEDGVPAFVLEEERFNRQKHTLKFPLLSLEAALAERKLGIGDIDVITTPWDTRQLRRTFAKAVLGHLPASLNLLRPGANTAQNGGIMFLTTWLKYELRRRFGFARLPPIVQVGHHDAHAAIFFASPFEEAAVLVMDGFGDASATSAYVGSGNRLECRWRGELLRLARHALHPRHLSSGLCALRGRHRDGARRLRRRHLSRRSSRSSCISRKAGSSRSIGTICATTATARSAPSRASSYETFGPPRQRDEPITDRHRDLAFALQATTEDTVLHVVRALAATHPSRNLCLTGGVALNCVANARILRDTDYRTRLGAALRLRHRRAARQRAVALPSDPRSPARLRDDASLLRHRL